MADRRRRRDPLGDTMTLSVSLKYVKKVTVFHFPSKYVPYELLMYDVVKLFVRKMM